MVPLVHGALELLGGNYHPTPQALMVATQQGLAASLPGQGYVVDGCATQDHAREIHLWVEHPLLGAVMLGQPSTEREERGTGLVAGCIQAGRGSVSPPGQPLLELLPPQQTALSWEVNVKWYKYHYYLTFYIPSCEAPFIAETPFHQSLETFMCKSEIIHKGENNVSARNLVLFKAINVLP